MHRVLTRLAIATMNSILCALKRQQSLKFHVNMYSFPFKQYSYSVNSDTELDLSSSFFQTRYLILEHLVLHSLVCKLSQSSGIGSQFLEKLIKMFLFM